MPVSYDRYILALNDAELEIFCRKWVEKLGSYHEVFRYGTSGDKGRDVVGFVTNQRHSGEWDNYQCKQYRTSLSKPKGLLAVGKVLYWASRGDFTPPRKFYFVAPKGLNGALLALIDRPDKFKQALVTEWDTACAKHIIQNQTTSIDTQLARVIDEFQFHEIHRIDIDAMLADHACKALLFEHLGADPGKYPKVVVPDNIQSVELPYIKALVEAYSERRQVPFADHDAVLGDPDFGRDLAEHRIRYFEADGFQKFYRDCAPKEVIEDFRRDMRLGVAATWRAPATDTLARVASVMTQSAVVSPGGPLSHYAYVPVKQGVCHHFVNEGEMSWDNKK